MTRGEKKKKKSEMKQREKVGHEQCDWRLSYRCQDAAAPDEREQVERCQLAGLIELAVFGFGQV